MGGLTRDCCASAGNMFLEHIRTGLLRSSRPAQAPLRLTCALVLAAITTCLAAQVPAQSPERTADLVPKDLRSQEPFSEYQVKAAYLFNFLKFVEWPEGAFGDPLAPIVIGVVGDDPFGNALPQVVAGKTVQGRDLVVHAFHSGENVRSAHILFISASEKKRAPMILSGLRGSPVLTVADLDGFLDEGGMIQFVNENDRVRFAINLTATSQARLKMSAKLLSLAKIVDGNPKAASR